MKLAYVWNIKNRLLVVIIISILNFEDPECYDTFAEVFHPVIADYHKVDIATLKSIHDLGSYLK